MAFGTVYIEDVTSISGDGVTNDMAAMSSLLQQVAASGGEVVAKRGATYRMVVDATVPNRGLLLRNSRLLLNGANLNFECSGESYGLRLGSGGKIEGYGAIRTVSSTSVPSFATSTWHAPVSAGYAYLDPDKGTVAAPGDLSTIRDVSVRGVTISTVRQNNSSALAIIGDVADGRIEDVSFDDSPTTTLALGFDWSSAGQMPVDQNGAWDVFTMQRNFLNGSFYSVHPHNFDVRRLLIGRMSMPLTNDIGGIGVRMSGCRDIVVDQVDVEEAGFAGFFNTAGDMGWEFAPLDEKIRAARGIRVNNFRVNKARWYGAYVDWYADNVAAAQQSGYQPMMSVVLRGDTVLDSFRTHGPMNNPDAPTSAVLAPGVMVRFAEGVEVRRTLARGHQNGVNFSDGCKTVKANSCEVLFSSEDGIVVGGSTAPQDCSVEECISFANGITMQNGSGIFDRQSVRTKIIRNVTGIEGESRQLFGIRTGTSTLSAVVVGNHCRGVKSGGGATIIGGTDVPGTCAIYRDNTAAAGVTPYLGATVRPPAYL